LEKEGDSWKIKGSTEIGKAYCNGIVRKSKETAKSGKLGKVRKLHAAKWLKGIVCS
jgi:hypothetical protein